MRPTRKDKLLHVRQCTTGARTDFYLALITLFILLDHPHLLLPRRGRYLFAGKLAVR